MSSPYKNILAIGAHVDDIELGCVGTLLKFQEQGSSIDVVVTNKPRSNGKVTRSTEEVIDDYHEAERYLGLNYCILPNDVLVWDRNSVARMDEVVRHKEYDLVITHSAGDFHQDHQTTFNIVNSSLRRFRGEFWCMEVSPYGNKNRSFNPNIFVNITKQMDQKITALKCYRKYFDEQLQHNVMGLASFRGQVCNAKYAEAFELQFRTC